MLNLLYDMSTAAHRIQSLRAHINELTEALHAEEMKLATNAAKCVEIRERELTEEAAKKQAA